MQGRRDVGHNVGRITRGLKKSTLSVMDENEVQRRQTSNVTTRAGAKDSLLLKPAANNSTRGLVERSINVGRSTTFGKKDAGNENKVVVKPPKDAVSKVVVRFGGGSMLISEDCAEDINSYMQHLEEGCALPENFLAGSAEVGGVDGRMRQILVDWLIHVQRRFSLLNETLSLAVFILDRSLLKMEDKINKNNLQLLGVSCMFVAAKFEEIMVPNIQDFVYVAADVFNKKDVLRMEQSVLNAIGFRFSVSHSIQFLRRYRFLSSAPKQVHNLAKFISEVGLVDYALAHFKPSEVAAASLYLAALVHKFAIPKNVFSEITQMDENLVKRIARRFAPSVLNFSGSTAKLYALRDKHKKDVTLPFSEDQAKRIKEFACISEGQ